MKLTKADKEWSKAVKDRDNWKCVICGSELRPNAHHILPREILKTKHSVMNGITLCPKHHRFSREISPHQNPLVFHFWLIKHRRHQVIPLIDREMLKLIKSKGGKTNGTKNT